MCQTAVTDAAFSNVPLLRTRVLRRLPALSSRGASAVTELREARRGRVPFTTGLLIQLHLDVVDALQHTLAALMPPT
jgi:hypothetical protein